MMKLNLRRLDMALAASLGLISFLLYLATLAPTLLFADGGEFQFVPYVLGLSHPTGYPLYLLLGWLWSHLLPWGEVAFRMNLFSALWGGVTIGLLYLAGLSTLAMAKIEPIFLRRPLAALAALAFATSTIFWSRAVMAEVYTFNTFFVALTLFILLLWAQGKENRLLYLFAFSYGLSLTHHRTMALLAPAYLLFIWLADPSLFRRPKRLAYLALLLALPQLLYLYIPLRAPSTSYLRLPLAQGRELVLYENNLRGFLRLTLGQAFGSRLGLYGTVPELLAGAFHLLRQQFPLPAIILGLIGCFRLLKARHLFWLLLLSYAGIVGFCLLHFRGDIKVFFIPSYLIFALWMALGMGALVEGANLLLRGAGSRLVALSALLLFALLPLTLLLQNYPVRDQSHDFGAREFWEKILAEPIPPGAILASNDRNEMMPLWYLQQVEGVRPDLLGLFPLIVPGEGYANIGRLLDSLYGLGRPLYLIKEMAGLEIKYRLQKVNSLVEVVSPAVADEPGHKRKVVWNEALELVGYDQEPHSVRPGDELTIALYWRAQGLKGVYSSYVHLVGEGGEILAQSDHQPGGVYYPTSLWREGEILRDEHRLQIPANDSPGAYTLLVGIYDSQTGKPLGEGMVVGKVGVKETIVTSPGRIENPLSVNLGDQVTLLGYDLRRQDGELMVTLHWQARREMEEDYTVFLHLVNEDGDIIAQADGQPRGGRYPTSIWDRGEVVVDERRLSVSDLPGGQYQLWAGLYILETMERLPILDATGKKIGDKVELGVVQID